MNRTLTSRLAKLEAASAPTGPRQVFRIVARDDAERDREMDRIKGEGFDQARDLVIIRTIVSPPEYPR